MFTTTRTLKYTLRGACDKAYSRTKPVTLYKLTPYTFVFGFSDAHTVMYTNSYSLKYGINILPTQDIGYQTIAAKLLQTINDKILVKANFQFQTILGNRLQHSTTVAYLDVNTGIIYTPTEVKTGCYPIPATFLVTFSHQRNDFMHLHVYGAILTVPYFKYSTLNLSIPSGVDTFDIPDTGLDVYPGVTQYMVDKGCPTVWKMYPPKVLIKAGSKYYTYTTDWEEVSPPITVETIMNRGIYFTRLNTELTVPDEIFEESATVACNTEGESQLKFTELVSVGWVFRLTFSNDFWREAYPSEYLIWPRHNGTYWLFLCGELR